MKFGTLIVAICLLGGLSLPSRLDAQSIDLVKLRKQEAERRKKLKQEQQKQVQITDSNLKNIAEDRNKPGFAESGSQTENVPQTEVQPLVIAADGVVDSQSPESEARRTPEYWQQLKRGLEESIAELENRVRENQSRLNLLHTQHLNQDLPLEKQRIKTELDELRKRNELEAQRLSQLKLELEELYERARKAGVPPGWLR
ncbi:MAG TPA: hypothetical protein ENN40_07630 [Candidatus Aminicenantes bacterium]|nr:hypothetical protein [Candidatus Aminicenantes bacterium]